MKAAPQSPKSRTAPGVAAPSGKSPPGEAPSGDPPADDSQAREADASWSTEFAEVSEYVNHYFAARSDLWRIRSSKLTWNLATGALAGIAGAALLAVAAARLLAGVAGGFAVLFGGRAWAGDLLTGALVLVAAGVGFTFIRMRAEKTRRRRLFEKYAQRRNLQTERFGHDLSDRAAG